MNPVRSKADILKWNTDVVFGMAEEYGYEVRKHTDTHFSLIHPTKGRFDYFPSTGRGGWFNQSKTHGGKLKQYGKTFQIKDIEVYVIQHFKPEQPDIKSKVDDLKTIHSNLREWCYAKRTEIERNNHQMPLFNCMDQAIIHVLSDIELRLRKIEAALTLKTGEDE